MPRSIYQTETIVANPDTFRLRDMLDDLSEGWEVTYEIKDVQSQDPVLNIRLNLPPQQIRRLLQKSFASQEPKIFEFPASFSPDLRQITVLKYLIRVLPSQPSDSLHLSNSSCALQDLEISGVYDPDHCQLEEHTTSIGWRCPCSYDWYRIFFSPMSRYLVVFRGPGQPNGVYMFNRMDLLVYRDESAVGREPNFVKVSRTLVKVNVHVGNKAFAFHPTLPILAISQLSVTSLWFFEEECKDLNAACLLFTSHSFREYLILTLHTAGKNTTTVLANPLKGLSFSHCGNFIHGEKVGGNKEFVMVPIARELQRFKPRAPKLFGSATLSRGQSELAPKEQHLMQLPTTVESQPTLGTDAVVFSQQQNGRQISIIRQYGNSGELVFYKTMDKGDFVSECLMRLPKSSSLDMGHATFLNTFETEADARIIINKELQDTYCVEESVGEDLKLPLLINRSRESIPRHMENKRLAVSEFNSPSKRICR